MASNGMKIIAGYLKQIKSFEKPMQNIKILTAGDGVCTATLKVNEDHLNILGKLHGGCSATIVDVVSSWALLTHENGLAPSVSVNMNITYIKAASKGDELLIDAKTIKAGKTLAFLDVVIKNNATGEDLIHGSHTKFIMRS